MASRLTVLSGPSGVGKSTVVAAIRRRHPEVWVSVSVTTRHPRPGETNGVEYFFISREEHAAMAAAGELLEHAEYTGNLYGTPRRPVERRLAEGTPVLLEIDVQGARQIRRAMPDALLVFLTPPSIEELERRLAGRDTEADDGRSRRLAMARAELAAEGEFDAVIVNRDVQQAAEELVTLMRNSASRRGRPANHH